MLNGLNKNCEKYTIGKLNNYIHILRSEWNKIKDDKYGWQGYSRETPYFGWGNGTDYYINYYNNKSMANAASVSDLRITVLEAGTR